MKIVLEILVVTSVLGICWAKNKCSGDIRNFTHTQHCPACLPPDDLHLKLDKLTVGNEQNIIYSDNFGHVCIEGSAKIPIGFVKPTDTLDLKVDLRVEVKQLGLTFPVPCGTVYAMLENQFFPKKEAAEDGDMAEGEEEDEVNAVDVKTHPWIKKLMEKFDYKTCGIYDICELLSPGEGLRDILDGAVNNSTDNLDVFDGYNTSEPNACSADFLQEQLKSLNDCFPLSLPEAFDISTYKEMAFGFKEIRLDITIELMKRSNVKRDDDNNGEKIENKDADSQHVLCLFLPLHVVF